MLATVARKPSPDKANEKRLVVYISQEMFQELEKRARHEDRSVSNYTRNLIANTLETQNKLKIVEENKYDV